MEEADEVIVCKTKQMVVEANRCSQKRTTIVLVLLVHENELAETTVMVHKN
jgi:hypothetical protein